MSDLTPYLQSAYFSANAFRAALDQLAAAFTRAQPSMLAVSGICAPRHPVYEFNWPSPDETHGMTLAELLDD